MSCGKAMLSAVEQADGDRQAEQSVGSQLQQHAGEDDAAGGRRFGVRQRKPGVDGEERHLDREAGQQPQQNPLALGIGLSDVRAYWTIDAMSNVPAWYPR